MTNQEAKHKAIQEAYGEYYNKLKPYIDKYGWITQTHSSIHYGLNEKAKEVSKIIDESQIEFAYVNGYLIPKSIMNIGSNSGWIRIEPDGSNLPTDEYKKYIAGKLENKVFKKCTSALEAGELSEYHTSMQVTHYRPVEEIPNPIY